MKDLSPNGQPAASTATQKPRLSRNAEDNKYMPLDARTWSEGYRMLVPCVMLIIMAIATGALVSFYLVSVDACCSVSYTVFHPCALKLHLNPPPGEENGAASTTHTLCRNRLETRFGTLREDRSHTTPFKWIVIEFVRVLCWCSMRQLADHSVMHVPPLIC